MKKILFAVFAFAMISAHAQTADEVVQKYIAKMGGLSVYNNIKSAKMTGTLSVQGMDLPITIVILNGRAVRTDVEVMGTAVISAYKDGKGWKQNQFAGAPDPTEVAGVELADLKTQSSIATTLMDYKARGSKIELLGQEDAEGVKAFKIKLTPSDGGKPTTYFLNASDYSIIKTISEREMMGQMAEVETLFSGIKDFGGAKFYLGRVQKVAGNEVQSLKLDNVELNGAVDEKIFDMPK